MAGQTGVNSKSCAQCESVFKKSQKSLNCQLCAHWFCLECSHVSVKLYEALKNEPSRNVPFNCDGCTRLLPKITELGNAIKQQNERVDTCEKKIDSIKESLEEVVKERVEKAINDFKDREDRKCNIIIHNVPEPSNGSENKKQDDQASLSDILAVIKCEDVGLEGFVRLGTPGGRPRLIKAVLRNVTDKHRILGGTKLLRQKTDKEYSSTWNNVFITPDLTKDERERNMRLKKELERRRTDENNPNLVISRGVIMQRTKPEGQDNQRRGLSEGGTEGQDNQRRGPSGGGLSTTRRVTFQ